MTEQRKRNSIRAARLLLSLLGAAFLTGCGGADTEEVQDALSDGVITVGILDGEDAYATKTGDVYVGIEPEILEEAGASSGCTVTYRAAASSAELMALLDSGEIEVAAGRLTEQESYTATHLSTRNYGKSGLYLLVPKHLYTDSLAGFSEGNIGISGSIPEAILSGLPGMEALQQAVYDDAAALAADLEGGVIKAGIVTEREALSVLRSGASLRAAELRNSPRLPEVFYLPNTAEYTTLRSELNTAINSYLNRQEE
ncbi:MAG: transporter substrate-binding domain-containing protein [Eubacteriales bacterium]|nr:transporter substrate-binding domain-containing protein [Eubacteriales bacterium]